MKVHGGPVYQSLISKHIETGSKEESYATADLEDQEKNILVTPLCKSINANSSTKRAQMIVQYVRHGISRR
ncbi:MAG: hypothetical protein QXR17_07880, partial [Candidatus Bathyarchaeia archaeon]